MTSKSLFSRNPITVLEMNVHSPMKRTIDPRMVTTEAVVDSVMPE